MPDKDTSSKTGYSQEDEYFKRKEFELLSRKRAELDAARQKLAEAHPAGPHWMKCPKCGGPMHEVKLDTVMVDQCTQCQGVHFDRGELELLIQSKQGGGFLKRLFG